jgi:hypothetical protein
MELEIYESQMLRHLVKLRDQAIANVSEYIGSVLSDHGLKVVDEKGKALWAVSLKDYKTIVATSDIPTTPTVVSN